MDIHDVWQWERCKELAKSFHVTIQLKRGFELSEKNGMMLGVLPSVAEVYAFLCGYEHSTHGVKKH
jgi:hypothetical protein